jgi:hypothetical protein
MLYTPSIQWWCWKCTQTINKGNTTFIFSLWPWKYQNILYEICGFHGFKISYSFEPFGDFKCGLSVGPSCHPVSEVGTCVMGKGSGGLESSPRKVAIVSTTLSIKTSTRQVNIGGGLSDSAEVWLHQFDYLCIEEYILFCVYFVWVLGQISVEVVGPHW